MPGEEGVIVLASVERGCRQFQSQRGIALIIVLWILTLLMLIASSFIHAMRTEINIVGNSVTRAKLEAAELKQKGR